MLSNLEFRIEKLELAQLTLSLLLLIVFIPTFAQTDTVQFGNIEAVTIQIVPPTVTTAGNMTTMSVQQIQRQQGNGSVNNLLELMPSMVTTSDAGTGLGYTYMRIRGIDHTRINTTLNGVTINDAESQGSWLVNLPDMGSYIEEVMVQSGANTTPGAISYGARVDFRTREIPDKPFAELNSAYGSFNTFHNSVSAGTGLIGDRFSALASFSDIKSNGFIDRANAQLNSVFFTAQYHFRGHKLPIKDYGTLRFNLLYGAEHTGLAWNGVPFDSLSTHRTYNSCGEYYTADGQRRYYADEKDNYQQTHYQLEYEKKWYRKDYHLRHELNAAAHLTRGIGYYQEYKDDKKPSKYGLLPADSTISTADFITQKYLDNYYYGLHTQYLGAFRFQTTHYKALNWIAGVDVDNYDGRHYGNVIWSQPGCVLDFPVDYQWYNGTGNKLQTKVFGSIKYEYKNFFVRGELQYRFMDYRIGGMDDNMIDVTQNYLWHFVNPKLSFHYLFDKNEKLKHSIDLSFSMANREPTRSDIVDAPESKKPVPETVYDAEFYYFMFSNKFHFNATLYSMFYKDQLVLTGEINDVGASIMTNVDKSYRIGLELAVAYQPVRFFEWHVNGCFSRNRIIDYVNFVDDWDNGGQVEEHLGNTPIAFSPDIVLSNDFTFIPLKNFDISLITKFVSKQYLDNSGNDDRCLKPYSYSNLRISYTFKFNKFAKELGLFFQVNNIFNAKYESNAWIYSYYYGGEKYADAGYYPQAGINFLGGIRMKF